MPMNYRHSSIRLPPTWIELNMTKRECTTFLAVPGEESLCQCGRRKIDHGDFVKYQHRPDTWSPAFHTRPFNTDAYGTILFEGEHHPNKAHYVRLSFDTNPEIIVQLMNYVWNLEMPQLLISVRGGSTNFDMSSRLGKIFQTGLIKAARNTNAWIFSYGLDSGIAKHLGVALSNERWMGGPKRKVVSVGIAPWGMIENRSDLIGRNKERTYSPLDHARSRFLHLNPRHSNFLLVDNGSIGKFGGENYLRRRLEKCIASYPTSPDRSCETPVVVVVVEGGFFTLRQVSDYLNDEPPIPVVIFAGTGRSADLMAWALRKLGSDEDFELMKDKIYHKIMKLFHIGHSQCSVLYQELRSIYAKKSLVSVYNPNLTTNEEDFDSVILSSIFRSQHWTPLEQLSLALVWDRVDIAHAEVFIYGREWSREHLEHAMMEALVSNRLDFVTLLLEHGLNMQQFLTAARLEGLYSLDRLPSRLMRSLLEEFSKLASRKKRKGIGGGKGNIEKSLTLHDIGIALTRMIGHVYKSSYIQMVVTKKEKDLGNDDPQAQSQTFSQPFDDLFVWAVLTKRHDMSKLLWRHGKGALAKALVAVKLNKFLAVEINASERTFTNVGVDFETYAEEWESLSVSLLDSCFRSNPKMARQLLTMELESWSKQTCLTLAVMANHRTLLGHPCCQILLADLWMGALNIKKHASLKIILGIVFPPSVFLWEYKSTEELRLLPHQERPSHAFGEFDPSEYDSNERRMSVTHGGRHEGDEDSLIVRRPSVVTYALLGTNSNITPEQSHHTSNRRHERKTDLAEVVRSVFPSHTDVSVYASHQPEQRRHETELYLAPHHHHHPHHISADDNSDFRFRDTLRMRAQDNYLTGRFHQLSSFVTTQHSLGLWSKFVEFQTAPVTNFYRHTIAYVIFIIALAYIILYPQDPQCPDWIEWYVIAYFTTQFLECIREFISIDAMSLSEKVAEIRLNVWRFGDLLVTSICLFCGVVLRLTGFFNYGMLIFRVSSIYWNLRLYKYLGAHRFVGPKIVMMRRMLTHMTHFAMIIVVVIISFGIARESISYPHRHPGTEDIAQAFLEPYIMMFGEADLETLKPKCGPEDSDEDGNPDCPTGYWIVPIAWVAYMLVSNILIVNVLIAVFNGIYNEIDAIAIEVWMFQRFNFVMEFEQKPILPPPLIILCHITSVLKFFYRSFMSCLCEEDLLLESSADEDLHAHVIMGNDHSLKSFLTSTEQTMVFDFEEENVDNITTFMDSKDSVKGNNRGEGGYALAFNHTDKQAFQQTKVILGEICQELDSQKAKLDKLINYWEMDYLANTTTEDREPEEQRVKVHANCKSSTVHQDGVSCDERSVSGSSTSRDLEMLMRKSTSDK